MSDKIEDVPNEPAIVVAPATAEDVATQDRNCLAKFFACAAFLLVTLALAILAAKRNLPLGWYLLFAACIVCSIGLLWAGIGLWHRNNGKDTFLISLIFLLAVLAMGASGILPIYFFPCFETDPVGTWYDDAIKNDFVLVTKTENLPSEVQSWWENDLLSDYEGRYSNYSRSNGNNTLYFDTTGVGLYTDTNGQDDGDDSEYLYRMENGKAPELVEEFIWPREFIRIDDSLACFIFATTDSHYMGQRYIRKVVCTDGINTYQTKETFDEANNLFYSNDLLWFRCTIHSVEIGYGNDVLYSMDPFSPGETPTLHSSLDESFDPFATRECRNASTLQTISWLFLGSIPALLLAISLDLAYKVPSMPIAKYASFTWLVNYGCSAMLSYGDAFDLEFIYWWWIFTTGPWLVLLTVWNLTNRITKSRMAWSINFAALVHTVGAFLFFDIFPSNDFVSDWVWLTVAVVPGLAFISMITGQIFLMILSAVVILIDVWRLLDSIVLPAQIVVLALTALLLGFLIYWVWKKQSFMQTVCSNWAKSKLSCWWRSPSIPSGEDNECPTHDANAP